MKSQRAWMLAVSLLPLVGPMGCEKMPEPVSVEPEPVLDESGRVVDEQVSIAAEEERITEEQAIAEIKNRGGHFKPGRHVVRVSLSNTQVTDAGLVHLKALTSLTTLDLSHTQVTDAGLKHLEGLTTLQSVSFEGTQISLQAMKALQRRLPQMSSVVDDEQVVKAFKQLGAAVELDEEGKLETFVRDGMKSTDFGVVAAEGDEGPVRPARQLSRPQRTIIDALNSPTRMWFVTMPLVDVVEFLIDYHEIEIQFDSQAAAGINKNAPVTCNLRGVSLRAGLKLILVEMDLACFIQDDHILITNWKTGSDEVDTGTKN